MLKKVDWLTVAVVFGLGILARNVPAAAPLRKITG